MIEKFLTKSKHKVLIWLLRNRPDVYCRLKGLSNLELARDSEFLGIHLEMLPENRAIQSIAERYNLYAYAKATNGIPGAIAEVGVYRGGSAMLLCKVKGDSSLYLFDTFAGMPQVDKATDGVFSEGDFQDTTIDEVRTYLANYQNVHFYQGFFPGGSGHGRSSV